MMHSFNQSRQMIVKKYYDTKEYQKYFITNAYISYDT